MGDAGDQRAGGGRSIRHGDAPVFARPAITLI